MAIAFVQKGAAADTFGGSSIAPTLAGTTAGNWLVLTCFWANPAAATAPVAPAGWTTAFATAGQVCTGSAGYHGGCSVFYKENIAGGSVTATVNSGGSGAWAIHGLITEFSGIATASSIDGTPAQFSATTGTTDSTGSLSGLAGNGELLIMCMAEGQLLGPGNGISDPATCSAGTATSINVSQNANTNATGEASYFIYGSGAGSGATPSASWSWNLSSEHGMGIAAFKPAGGSGVTVALTGQAATFTAGTVVPSNSGALVGQSAIFTAGTLSPAISVALNGQAATFAAGTVAPNTTVALLGQGATFTAGTFTASTGGNVTVALTGQSAAFTAGTLVPSLTVAMSGQSAAFSTGSMTATPTVALIGQAITSAAGTFGIAASVALTGQGIIGTLGAFAPETDASLTGQSATFASGLFTASETQDVTVALTGIAAIFTPGYFTSSGADVGGDTHDGGTQVIRESHYRKVLKLKKKGQVERADLLAEAIVPLMADKRVVLQKMTDDEDVISIYLADDDAQLQQLTDIGARLITQLVRK